MKFYQRSQWMEAKKAIATGAGGVLEQQLTVLDTYDRSFLRQDTLWIQIDGRIFSLDLKGNLGLVYESESVSGCKPLDQSELKVLPHELGQVRSDEFRIFDHDGKTIARVDGWTIFGQDLVAIRPLKGYEAETLATIKPLKALKGMAMTKDVIATWLTEGGSALFPGLPLGFFMTPSTPIQKALVDISQNFFQVARFYEGGIVDDKDPECLHQYRVFVRKVRSYLSLMGSFFPPPQLALLKDAFREFQQRTNRLRDLDVHLIDESSGDNEGLSTKVQLERQNVYRQVKQWLSSQEYGDLARAVEQVFEQSYKWPFSSMAAITSLSAARSILNKIHSKIVRATGKIHTHTNESDIHRVRILYKKLRYLMEFFSPLEDRKKTRLIKKKLKVIQEELGRFNDLAVQINFLKQDSEIPESVLNERSQKKELAKGSVLAHLDDFLQPEVAAAFDRLFHNGDEL